MSAVGTELAFILRTAFAADPFSRRSGLAAVGTEFARILCTAFRAGPFSRRSGSGFSAVGAELARISSRTALRTFLAHAAFIARRRTHSVRLCVYENARPHSGI